MFLHKNLNYDTIFMSSNFHASQFHDCVSFLLTIRLISRQIDKYLWILMGLHEHLQTSGCFNTSVLFRLKLFNIDTFIDKTSLLLLHSRTS